MQNFLLFLFELSLLNQVFQPMCDLLTKDMGGYGVTQSLTIISANIL